MNGGQLQLITKEERNAQIKKLSEEGYSVEQLAKKFGLSKDTIWYLLDKEIERERSQAMRAAKDFNYGEDVIEAIKIAKKEGEIAKIMRNARIKKFG